MTNVAQPAIQCIGLFKSFGNRTVLRDIHFTAREGSILALVGPNGAGKTTLLKILAALITPSEGTARIFGEDVAGESLRVKQNIGYVPSEERSFYWRLTGRQNLEFFAALHGIHGAEKQHRIDMAIEAVGMQQRDRMRFREYSTGMKQALAIARGILHDPAVLILDEPTRSLSPEAAQRVCELLRRKAKEEGKTVLFASHNMSEVARIADEVAVLREGALEAASVSSHETHEIHEKVKEVGQAQDWSF